eukprot:1178780-Prorocentrum_minimum.AAC.7
MPVAQQKCCSIKRFAQVRHPVLPGTITNTRPLNPEDDSSGLHAPETVPAPRPHVHAQRTNVAMYLLKIFARQVVVAFAECGPATILQGWLLIVWLVLWPLLCSELLERLPAGSANSQLL